MKMMKMVEGIIEWQDREVLRRINVHFKTEAILEEQEYDQIIKEVRKPQVDIDIEKEIEDD